jgi:hypothetical protein
MGKALPPHARRKGLGYGSLWWAYDWGGRLHEHHHSTRKHPGAFKPIRKWKTRPRGAEGTFFARLKRRFRKSWSKLRRG